MGFVSTNLQVIGTNRTYALPLTSGQLDPVTAQPLPWSPSPFTGYESFSATLSQGAGYVPLVTLTPPAWIGSPSTDAVPTVLFSVNASDIASFSAGDYYTQILLNPGTSNRLVWGGTLRLIAGVGTKANPLVYADLQDMVDLMSWIQTVEDLGPGLGLGSATNFFSYLVQASQWLRNQCYARARKALLYQIRLQGPNLALALAASSNGYDAGPWFGPSTLPDPILQGELTLLNGYINTPGCLMIDSTEDMGQTRRMVAAYAIYLALRHLRGSTGPKDEDGVGYQGIAKEFRREALWLLSGWVARIDINADGIADYELRA